MTPSKLKVARELIDAGELTVGQVAATIGVSRSSLYRALSTS
jgi:DNA-binding phage protein